MTKSEKVITCSIYLFICLFIYLFIYFIDLLQLVLKQAKLTRICFVQDQHLTHKMTVYNNNEKKSDLITSSNYMYIGSLFSVLKRFIVKGVLILNNIIPSITVFLNK